MLEKFEQNYNMKIYTDRNRFIKKNNKKEEDVELYIVDYGNDIENDTSTISETVDKNKEKTVNNVKVPMSEILKVDNESNLNDDIQNSYYVEMVEDDVVKFAELCLVDHEMLENLCNKKKKKYLIPKRSSSLTDFC